MSGVSIPRSSSVPSPAPSSQSWSSRKDDIDDSYFGGRICRPTAYHEFRKFYMRPRGAGMKVEAESNVRRTGYPDSWHVNGSQKESSFFPYPAAGSKGARGEEIAWNHPSTWKTGEIRDLDLLARECNLQEMRNIDNGEASLMEYRVKGIPGYRGFIPGKASETVFGSTFRQAQIEARHVRRYCEGSARNRSSIQLG